MKTDRRQALLNAVWAILEAQGMPVEERMAQWLLTLEMREYVVRTPDIKPSINIEDAIQEAYEASKAVHRSRIKVRPGLTVKDNRK